MNNQMIRYKRQYKNALITYEKLKAIKEEIELKLHTNPVNSSLLRDLRKVELDIKITSNEIEHIESRLFKVEI